MATGRDGFTMVEMMVVVATICILALIAMPSYLDQIVRKQIVDAVPLADIAKTPIAAGGARDHGRHILGPGRGRDPGARGVKRGVRARYAARTFNFGTSGCWRKALWDILKVNRRRRRA